MLKRFRRMPISRQLSITAGASIILFSLMLTAVTSTLIARQLRDRAVMDAQLQTEQFAERSLFAFLIDDPTVAEETIASITTFPTIRHAALIRSDGAILASSRAIDNAPILKTAPRHLTAVTDHPEFWVISAPVLSSPSPATLDEEEPTAEFLGGVVLTFSKSPVRDANRTILLINGLAGIAATGIFLWLLSFQMRVVTDPLRALSDTMGNDGRHSPRKRTTPFGSKEVREIAAVYNRLMDTVDQAQAALESQVAIRTEELKSARDAALAANRQKSEIMAAVTHEMKTPLTAIIGYAQLTLEDLEFALDGDAAGRSREQLGNILGRAHELLNRITQMLDLARAEAGKFELNLTDTDIEALLATTMKSVHPLAAERGNKLTADIECPTPVRIDADKFHQIALNLLTNACKFTQAGKVTLRCRADNHEICLEVADTGVGIEADSQEAIFEPFHQIDMSQSRPAGGTGLGLAVSRQFARLMRGEISVQSKTGLGSTFSVVIPLPVKAPS